MGFYNRLYHRPHSHVWATLCPHLSWPPHPIANIQRLYWIILAFKYSKAMHHEDPSA